jgi:altronate dehydratase large subunit
MSLSGYRRPDGRVGFRNHVLVLSTVACANGVVSAICKQVPEAVMLPMDSGCGMLKEDQVVFAKTLTNLAGNPNVAAVLCVGLGCEAFKPDQARAAIQPFGKPVEAIAMHSAGGYAATVEKGVQTVRRLLHAVARMKREPVDVSDLILGLNCGASDPASGLTANQALGAAVDLLVDAGGSAIIGVTTDCVGAEEEMASNAASPDVARRILDTVHRFENHVKMYGADLSTGEPNQGNMEAGLSTLEEKSLGCIRKIGSRPIVDVIEYAEIPTRKGPLLMDSPSYDAPSVTGIVAGGAQVVVFTTGLGTPFGMSIVPVIKMMSNTPAFKRMEDTADVNAGTILDGEETIAQTGTRLFDLILEVANGRTTRAEELGENQCQIWRTTLTL